MKLKLKSLQKPIALILVLVFFSTTLVFPFFNSLSYYLEYKQIAVQQHYANANVRSLKNNNPILLVFGGCSVKVSYDFVNTEDKIVKGADSLNCRYKNKIPLGNSIPVFYNSKHPEISVSQFGLATKPSQILNNCLLGIVGILLIIGAWFIFKLNHKKLN
jgi:hypothetical protein